MNIMDKIGLTEEQRADVVENLISQARDKGLKNCKNIKWFLDMIIYEDLKTCLWETLSYDDDQQEAANIRDSAIYKKLLQRAAAEYVKAFEEDWFSQSV